MAKVPVFSNETLKLIFHGIAIPNLAQNATTTPVATFYMSLHYQSPITVMGSSGLSDQTTVEVAYTGYARQAITRDATGWNIVGSDCLPVNAVQFPTVAGISASAVPLYARFFGVGTVLSGVGKLLFVGQLLPIIQLIDGVKPRIDVVAGESQLQPGWSN